MHVHADLKLTDDLYGGPYLGITENDVCYSVAKLFFAYGLGNALTFPMSAGALHGAAAGPADAGRRRGAASQASGHGVLRGADVLCGVPRKPGRAGSAAR